MTLPPSVRNGLTSLSQQDDDDFDLCEANLLLAKLLKPSLDLAAYRERINQLISDLHKSFEVLKDHQPPLRAKVSALQNLMCAQEGFHGDEDAFNDLDHMNLACVLDHKCGTALALSMLYIHCAQACGWSVMGLNFPGCSLVCMEDGNQRAILDPFQQAAELDAYTLRQMIKVLGGAEAELQPLFYDSLSPKTLFIRHLRAVKSHFLRCDQLTQGLEILQALTTLEPQSAAFWRETGLLQARIGQIDAAIDALQTALSFTEEEDARRHTRHILDDLKKKQT